MKGALLVVHPCTDEAEVVARARRLPGRVQACVALDRPLAYIYAWGAAVVRDGGRRLATLGHWRGASEGERAPYHYVVATDVEAGWEEELNRWYEAEHMPGLAAVPGNVRCARLRSEDGSPRYHACYDLVSPRVLEHPEWLAVRHSEWSSRVRPHFRNTVRIMFRTVLDDR